MTAAFVGSRAGGEAAALEYISVCVYIYIYVLTLCGGIGDGSLGSRKLRFFGFGVAFGFEVSVFS